MVSVVRVHQRRGVRTSRLLCVFGLIPCAVWAQALGSVGIGAGTVRYADSTHFGSAAISPQFEFASPNFTTNVGGSFASLPFGAWSSQGRADIWMATPAGVSGLRLGLEAIGAGTRRTDGAWSAAGHGIAELLWSGRRWGVGIGAGPSAGWIVNEPPVTSLHARARLWGRIGATTYAASVEPTRFPGGWFTDLSGGVTVVTGPVTTSLWAAQRLSAIYGSKGAASAFVQVFPAANVAIEVGGGSYLPEPYQGLPRARYVTVGVRLYAPHRKGEPAAPALSWPPLMPMRHGDSVVVRFRMEGAGAVAIAGDWDGWRPRDLRSVGADLWEGALALRSGTYHFNLLVDHKDWVVPGGVAITDDLGGMVGVLVVP